MFRLLRYAFATFAAAILLLVFAAVALADSPNPTTIQSAVSGNTVTLNGTWAWNRKTCNAATDRFVGWEVDWGDNTQFNPIKSKSGFVYHMGTQTDNVVDTHHDCGTPGGPGVTGTWGPINHTYATPGNYKVCVVTYDIHVNEEFKASGHNRIAGGPNHNSDNSIESNAFTPQQGGVDCIAATVSIPAITIQKTVCEGTAGVVPSTCAGENITTVVGKTLWWRIIVKNTGATSLTNVTLADNQNLGNNQATCPTIPTTLTAGQTYTCNYSTVAVQGTHKNTATVNSTQTGPKSDSAQYNANPVPTTAALPASVVLATAEAPTTASPAGRNLAIVLLVLLGAILAIPFLYTRRKRSLR